MKTRSKADNEEVYNADLSHKKQKDLKQRLEDIEKQI